MHESGMSGLERNQGKRGGREILEEIRVKEGKKKG